MLITRPALQQNPQ